jgi:hypothetical protein
LFAFVLHIHKAFVFLLKSSFAVSYIPIIVYYTNSVFSNCLQLLLIHQEVMRFSVDQLTLAAAVLATVTSAKPTQKNSAFTVHQVAAPGRSVRMTGAKAFRHAYAKHNMKLPARYQKHTVLHQQKTVKARTGSAAGDGSVTASPVDLSDDEYISPVTVGGQTLNIDFDTGSSDL